jgi:hypothetical protein
MFMRGGGEAVFLMKVCIIADIGHRNRLGLASSRPGLPNQGRHFKTCSYERRHYVSTTETDFKNAFELYFLSYPRSLIINRL